MKRTDRRHPIGRDKGRENQLGWVWGVTIIKWNGVVRTQG